MKFRMCCVKTGVPEPLLRLALGANEKKELECVFQKLNETCACAHSLRNFMFG